MTKKMQNAKTWRVAFTAGLCITVVQYGKDKGQQVMQKLLFPVLGCSFFLCCFSSLVLLLSLFGYFSAGEDPCGGGRNHCEWDSVKWNCQLHLLHAKVLDPAWHLSPVRDASRSWTGLRCPVEQTLVARLLHAASSLTPPSPPSHQLCTKADACGWTRNAMRWSWYHWSGMVFHNRCSVPIPNHFG